MTLGNGDRIMLEQIQSRTDIIDATISQLLSTNDEQADDISAVILDIIKIKFLHLRMHFAMKQIDQIIADNPSLKGHKAIEDTRNQIYKRSDEITGGIKQFREQTLMELYKPLSFQMKST